MNKLYVTISLLLFMIFVSCSKDSDTPSNINEPEKAEKTIYNAGEFSITNLSSKENVDGSEVKLINGDTLKVVFKPKNEYKDYSFTVSCTSLNKLNDSLFVVSNLPSNRNEVLFTSASSKVEKKDSILTYFAERKVILNIPSSYVIIPFHLEATQDLLQMTTAEITCKNGDGTQSTIVLNEDDWVCRDSSTIYLYVDAEGKKHYTAQSTPEDGWTKVEERKFASNSYYDFKVRYFQLGVDNEIIVKYIPKSLLSMERDSYSFYHSLDRSIATVVIPGVQVIDIYSSTNISINIGSDYGVKKDDVKSYLDNLRNTQDVFKFNISNNGSITKVSQ